jgi:hypothetical protein
MYHRNPIKIMCTTRLNDGTFTVHRFSVATSARLHQSECVFRFFVYLTIYRDFFFFIRLLCFRVMRYNDVVYLRVERL